MKPTGAGGQPDAGTAALGPKPRAADDRERLRCIYEISVRLAAFDSVAHTVPAVLGFVSETLPLQSALLTCATDHPPPPPLHWQPDGKTDRALPTQVHAQRAYLTLGLNVDAKRLEREMRESVPSDELARLLAEPQDGTILVLPLALTDGTIFGALLLECVVSPDEFDVLFANVVVSQLAIALDRDHRMVAEHALRESRRIAAKHRENSWHLLASVSSVLSSSLDYRASLSRLATLAVPLLGEVCLIDLLREDGGMERAETSTADSGLYAAAQELMVVAGDQPTRFAATEHPTCSAQLHAMGLQSMMVVPVLDNGAVVGALTFLAKEANRYSHEDIVLAEDIGRRVASTIGNARVYNRAQTGIQSREALLAIVAHDLQNPLSVIIMLLMILRKNDASGERSAAESKQLDTMRRATTQMTGLLADILDSASMDAGQFSVAPTVNAVDPLLEAAIENAEPVAARKHIQVTREVVGRLGDVRADSGRVQQVFTNLLSNAIKFAPEGGTIAVRAFAATDLAQRCITFSVTNDGPAIPAQDSSRLFDRFWQASLRGKVGTGLGLFIARAIVEAHGGTIWVESNAGEGTTFYFNLPLA